MTRNHAELSRVADVGVFLLEGTASPVTSPFLLCAALRNKQKPLRVPGQMLVLVVNLN